VVNVALLFAAGALGLAQPPYVGIACKGVPNVTTCGRIGIAVWLKRPARRVDATLSREHVRLHSGGLGGTGPKYWEGYVQIDPHRLGLPKYWYGTKPVKILTLHLVVRDGGGRRQGSVRVQLKPGWG
jgi:hypothetical protein